MRVLLSCCCWAVLLVAASAKFNHGLKKAVFTSASERYFNHVPAPLLREDELPKELDWCDKDGVNYCVPSWNQHIPRYCGSCFLHATLSMVMDRLKIAKGGRSPDVMLGRQTFLNCAPPLGYSDGCNGGDVIDVLRYMREYGLPDEGCMPYSARDYTHLGLKKKKNHRETCAAIDMCTNCMPDERNPSKDSCWAVRSPVIYKVKRFGNVGPTKPSPDNVAAMMSEIYARGPITCSISCPDKFTWSYDGEVFVDKTNDTDVDHDIEVVGWGEDEHGQKFWKIRNSWGQYWGVNGFARIARGINAQQIEGGDCWYAEPTWDVEQDVADGKLVGSMYGLRPSGKRMEELTTPQGQQQAVAAA